MTEQDAQNILNTIIESILRVKNPFTLDAFMNKYAFDIRLPKEVSDIMTGQPTWAGSLSPQRFASMRSTQAKAAQDDWIVPKQPLNDINEILAAWQNVNITATERYIESENIGQSDTIYNSQNVFRSLDVHGSKNVIFCDSVVNSEYVAASARSQASSYCVRLEDSKDCANSFAVNWSGKVANSMFIHNSYDMYECLFCSHMSGKRYCVANMQLDEADYMRVKQLVIQWLVQN